MLLPGPSLSPLGVSRRRRSSGGGGTPIAINFRDTSGFVTDGAGETYCLADTYPTTRGGVTFGWEDAIGFNRRDRSSSVDRRLAGINFATTLGTRFRVDLPAAGAYSIRFAGGDPIASGSPGHWDFRDGTTSLFAVDGNGSGFVDAAGTNYSAANWPGSNAAQSVTFAGTIFRLVTTTADANFVAHLLLTPL